MLIRHKNNPYSLLFVNIITTMKKIKIISRAVVIHDNKLLLVKNYSRDFWSFPGGHWEFEDESLGECAIRETEEETGRLVELGDIIFYQEFRKPDSIVVEIYWSASISNNDKKVIGNGVSHTDVDKDSEIEKAVWFDKKAILGMKILPSAVVDYFVNDVHSNTFIGVFNYK